MEERKHTLEKIEIARDALTMQLRNLEQTLQEKDIQVEVSFSDDCQSFLFHLTSKNSQIVSIILDFLHLNRRIK